mmetsp:Transcript_15380/g.49109  ORF Transcript_15380/g.49109 Transcript_15380/m.49109 type:complete len:204 (+) Transcript_15380:574-1185(+)
MALLEWLLVLLPHRDQIAHVHLLERGQHGCGVLGVLKTLRDTLAHAVHLGPRLRALSTTHKRGHRRRRHWRLLLLLRRGRCRRRSRRGRRLNRAWRGGRRRLARDGRLLGRGTSSWSTTLGRLRAAQGEQRRAHIHHGALLSLDGLQHARLRRTHVHGDLVRLDHDQHIVHVHIVSNILLPRHDGALRDRVPHARHRNIHHIA